MKYQAGGCAQNTLRIFQWIMKKRANTYMFGAVGDDVQGQKLKEIVERDGVITRWVLQSISLFTTQS